MARQNARDVVRSIAGHGAQRGPETDHVVPAGRVAERTHHVAAISHRHHAKREGHRCASARAARGARGVPGVARHPEHGVVALRAVAEFGHVGFADEQRSCRADTADEHRVTRGHGALRERSAAGGAQTTYTHQILGGIGHAVHPATPLPPRKFGIAGLRFRQQFGSATQRDDRVDPRVVRLDLGEVGLHDLRARHRAAADGLRERQSIETCNGAARQRRRLRRQRRRPGQRDTRAKERGSAQESPPCRGLGLDLISPWERAFPWERAMRATQPLCRH